MDCLSRASRLGTENDMSRSSSVYSHDSDYKPAPLFTHFGNGSQAAGRSVSAPYTPSFMSQHATKSTERLTTPTSQSSGHRVVRKPVNTPTLCSPSDFPAQVSDPLPSPGALLILIAMAIPPPTLSYIQMLLERQTFSTIAITAAASQEALIKQLKIDIYALIGKLGKELGVLVYTHEELQQPDIENIMQGVVKTTGSIQGVICCPGTAGVSAEESILDVSEAQLQHLWQQSTLFLHKSFKATAQSLLSRCTPEKKMIPSRSPRGPFFLVAAPSSSSVAAKIIKCASDQLLHQLAGATETQGLVVGHAEAMLIPELRIKTITKEETPLRHDDFVQRQQDQPITPSESPTKLWNMWALQDDVGHAD